MVFNLLFALILLGLEQLLERVVFVFTIIFVQPIPESYDSSEWLGMVWGYSLDPRYPFIVSPFFKDKESAKRLFLCIKGWNYLKTEDVANNVRISVIIENEDTYTVYMYPSAERDVIVDFKNENIKQNRELQLLLVQIMFCKQFDLKGSKLLKFKDIYKVGSPFIFRPYFYENGNAEPIRELGHILKYDLKIADRSKLTKADPEFEHGKFIIT